MVSFVVVQKEIWSSDGGVHTLEEAYKMVEELKLCISQMETCLTPRAADVGYCVCKGNYSTVYRAGAEVCSNCKRLRR